jgi:dephospho-CoA kinase
MAAQASRDERLKLADHVLTNDGSVEELEKQVDALWRELKR